MTMHYTERAQAIVRLGKELQKRGWMLFGYNPGESDAMTDYYRAAHWDGIATHPHHAGVVVGVDVSAGLADRASRKDGWPSFHATPKGRIWHVERDGQIVDSEVDLEPCVRAGWQQAVEKLADRIEEAIDHRPVKTTDKRASTIPVTVKHERTWTWLYFPDKPDEAIREALKQAFGARWGKHRRAWYITRHVEADEIQQVISSAAISPEISRSFSPDSPITNEDNMSNRFKLLPKAMAQPAPYREEKNTSTPAGIAGFVAGKGSAHDYLPAWMTIPPLYSAEGQENPLALIKLFTPDSSWTWYVLEYDGEDTLFTLCVGQDTELGYTSLGELRSVRGPLKLPIERDLWFEPRPVTELEEYIEKWGCDGPYHSQMQTIPDLQTSEFESPMALEIPDGWAVEDIRFLLQKLEGGQLVLVADEKLGIPTIHTDFGVEIEHFGYGLMGAKGPGYSLTFDAGGAMEKTPGGKSWSALHLEGDLPYVYDHEGVMARLKAYLPLDNGTQERFAATPEPESSFVPIWQIPLSEFLSIRGDSDERRSEHKAAVQGALLDHLAVADDILLEYPGLAWWKNTFQSTLPHLIQRDVWAMEYLKSYFILNENSTRSDELVLAEGYQKHRGFVQQAVEAGALVPADVLADYADLHLPTQVDCLPLTYGRNEANQAYFEGEQYMVLNPLLVADGQEYGVCWFWFQRKNGDWVQMDDLERGEGVVLGSPSLSDSLARAEAVIGTRFHLVGAPEGLLDEYPVYTFKKMATGEQAEDLLREVAAINSEMSGRLAAGDGMIDMPQNPSSTAAALPISGPTQTSASSQPDAEGEFTRWELELTTGHVGKKQSIFHRTLLQITCPAALEIALQRIQGDLPRCAAIEKRLADLQKAGKKPSHPAGA